MANNALKKSKSCQKKLNDVPFEKGFHFCTDGGRYTGITALSLADLTEKLKTIDEKAIAFHLDRDDFQKWITDVFCDEELAWRIDRIDNRAETARQELIDIVSSHVNYLVTV